MATKKPSTPKTSRPKRLKHKQSLSRASLIIFVVAFGAVGYFIWRSFAAPPPPTEYLSVASQTFGGSTSFSVQVRENSGTTTVNAVQANLSYPATLVDLVSIDYTGSAFGTQAESSGAAGVIKIGRGTCGGCAAVTGDQLVATLNFKTKTTSGAATVAFTTGTLLVSSTTNTDILGSLAATAGGTYTIDLTPPTVSITSPANNATLAGGGTVTISATASDTNSSISKVEFYVDGILSGTVSTSPYNYAWNTSAVSLASHTLQAKAYDTFSNVASSALVTVTLTDQTAPTAPASFRTTGSTLNTIGLAWNASTDNVGVTSYKIKRAGVLIATVTPPTLTYTDTGLAVGTSYSYTIQAFDAANNASTASSLSVATLNLTPGDVNADGHVDVVDLSIMLSNWATADAASDVNHDGTVNVLDLSTLLSHYGQ